MVRLRRPNIRKHHIPNPSALDLDTLGSTLGHHLEVDLGTVGVTVGADEDVILDDPRLTAGCRPALVVLAPARREIPVVTLDDARELVHHPTCRGQLVADEGEVGGVLITVATRGEEVEGEHERAVRLPTLLEDVERGVGILLGHLVDDHDTAVVVDALPTRLVFGGVEDDDRRGVVVRSPIVDLDSGREHRHGGTVLGLKNELARTADYLHDSPPRRSTVYLIRKDRRQVVDSLTGSLKE